MTAPPAPQPPLVPVPGTGTESPYPEHDKLAKVATGSQTIGAFLDWLGFQGVHRMRYETVTGTRGCWGAGLFSMCTGQADCRGGCGGSGLVAYTREAWMHDTRGIERLLADYFEIDLDVIEQEKRAMLDELRARQAATSGSAP